MYKIKIENKYARTKYTCTRKPNKNNKKEKKEFGKEF